MKWILLYIVSFCSIKQLDAQALIRPDTVLINSDTLVLKGLLWRPLIQGPLPAIIYCHGSYETTEAKYNIIEQVSMLGSLYAKNGHIFCCELNQEKSESRTPTTALRILLSV